MAHHSELACASGKHVWLDEEDRRHCCNGYHRVQSTSRRELEEVGAEHIVLRQMFRGWAKDQAMRLSASG